jgi:hypothetical protein
VAVGWQHGLVIDDHPQPSLDELGPELALVREAGLEPLDIEALAPSLSALTGLGVVRRRTRVDTALGTATAIAQVVREAALRLDDDLDLPGPNDQLSAVALAQMLFRVHYATRKLSAAEARTKTQEASGVGDRQYRAHHERRLLRLVAQALLELDREDDLHRWGSALEVGADVPQSVALYWLELFRDHYFRMETSAYALQADLMTAHVQLRDDLASWNKYLATAVYWNVEFSFLRQRFFLRHGPLWFAITDEGCTQLNDSVERIEYHDAFPDEFMAKLRRIYGAADIPDHDDFERRLTDAGLRDTTIDKAERWLRRCECPDEAPDPRCEVHHVLRHCDLLGQTVEQEFERIQNWYRTDRFAADPGLRDLITNYRTPGRERAEEGSDPPAITPEDIPDS